MHHSLLAVIDGVQIYAIAGIRTNSLELRYDLHSMSEILGLLSLWEGKAGQSTLGYLFAQRQIPAMADSASCALV